MFQKLKFWNSLYYYTAANDGCQKEKTAFTLLEPLILYFVLFFPASAAQGSAEAGVLAGSIPFSSIRELSRTFSYTIPSLALIWYLVLEKKSLGLEGKRRKPGFRDIYPFVLGFPALILIGLGISFLISLFSAFPAPLRIEAPGEASGWVIMAFSCIGTGYLEESYFRFYFLEKLEETGTCLWVRVLLSVLLFAFCHIYEGPWGVLNAALAGCVLAFLYEKFRSLHGIAWAHGAYNAFVYVIARFL
ncbi:MAG: CPBP family intramembrane metalloprotease [Treponema sp.]|nr:CPBP family intramembrane metalloprotease [Treponema sp.]